MNNFKKRWEIKASWQLIYPFLGIIALFFSAWLITYKTIGDFLKNVSPIILYLTYFISILFFFILFLKITLWLFNKLRSKWGVTYRWELIAIFLVFAITGSASARVSGPLLEIFGFQRGVFADDWYWGFLYWSIRILIIFPIYQVLLIAIGFLFGQYKFFRAFEEKMLSRLGFSFLFSSK